MNSSYDELLLSMARLAVRVGQEIIMPAWNRGELEGVRYDDEGELVTNVDRAAEDATVVALEIAYPDIPFFAEERVRAGETAIPAKLPQRYFLVDAVDGTMELVKHRGGGFTVQYAMIEDGKPVCGIVYQPVQDVLMAGLRGQDGIHYVENASQKSNLLARPLRTRAHFNLVSDGPVVFRFNPNFEPNALREHVLAQAMMREFAQAEAIPCVPGVHQLVHCVTQEVPYHIAAWTARGRMWDVSGWDVLLENVGGAVLRPNGDRLDFRVSSYGDKPFQTEPLVFVADRARFGPVVKKAGQSLTP